MCSSIMLWVQVFTAIQKQLLTVTVPLLYFIDDIKESYMQ